MTDLTPTSEAERLGRIAEKCAQHLLEARPTGFLQQPSDLLFLAYVLQFEKESKNIVANKECRGYTKEDVARAIGLCEQHEANPHFPVSEVPEMYVTVSGHNFHALWYQRVGYPLWYALMRKLF